MGYVSTDMRAAMATADWTQIDTKLAEFLVEFGKVQGALSGLNATPTELNGLDLSAVGAASKIKKVALPIVAATTETDTTLILPAKSIIKNAFLLVATPEATGGTKTITLGIKAVDADGLLKATSVAAAGLLTGTLLNTGQTLGALLCQDESGAGVLVPEPYVCAAAATITYSLGSNDFEELVAYAIIEYIEIA